MLTESEKEKIRNLDFCAWCGKNDNVHNYFYLDGYTVFCKDDNSPCLKYYTIFFESGHRNMTNGVPIVYSKLFPEKYVNAKEENTVLSCCYCGTKNEDVITNTAFVRVLQFADFCSNNICCREYCNFRSWFRRIPACLCNNDNTLLSFRQPVIPKY